MSISYCKKCHEKRRGKNYEETVEELKNILNEEEVESECQSYCGPGSSKNFVIVDDEIIESDSHDELIKKLEEKNDH